MSTLESVCTVSGAMSFVLRFSRVFGVAPLKFEKTPGGWHIQVSRLYSFYGKIGTNMFTFFTVAALLVGISEGKCGEPGSHTLNKCLMWLADIFSIAVVLITTAWTGPSRMRHMINSMTHLRQVNNELQCYCRPFHLKERDSWLIVVLSLIFGCVIITLDHISVLFIAIAHNDVLLATVNVFYGVLNITLLLVVLQLTLLAMWVTQNLQLLNGGLENLLQEIYKEKVTLSLSPNPESVLIRRYTRTKVFTSKVYAIGDPVKMDTDTHLQTAPEILNRLAVLYCSLCDVIRELNDSHGPVLLLLYLSFFLHLIITPYRVFVYVLQIEQFDIYSLLIRITWTIFHLTKLLMLTEPCHRFLEQMLLTKNLINQTLRYTSLDDFAIISELKWFSRHIVLNQVSFTLSQFCDVNRTLAATIITSITTYLVILVQFLPFTPNA